MSNSNRKVHRPSMDSEAYVPKTLQTAKEEFEQADQARKSLKEEYERPFAAAEAKKQKIDAKLLERRKALIGIQQEIKQLEKDHEIQKEIYDKQYDDDFNCTGLLLRCIKLKEEVRKERSSVQNIEKCTKEMQDIGGKMTTMTNNMKNYLKTEHGQQ